MHTLPITTAVRSLQGARSFRPIGTPWVCPPTLCALPYQLNPETCRCECPPVTCASPTLLNPATCACECPPFGIPRVCPSPAFFSSTTCECACPDGLTFCNSPPFCMDAKTDRENCGGCGRRCIGGRICQGGACVCPPPLTDCGNPICTNLYVDPKNCGACGRACPTDQACCNGLCTPLGTNDNCAWCGNECLSGTDCCAGGCRDFTRDPQHCGSCGN